MMQCSEESKVEHPARTRNFRVVLNSFHRVASADRTVERVYVSMLLVLL
jgi:hypothetical protein